MRTVPCRMEPATSLVEAKVERSLLLALQAAARQNCRTVSGEIRAMLRERFKD